MLRVVCWLLVGVVSCLLVDCRCSLCVIGCSLRVACCVLLVDCCLLLVARLVGCLLVLGHWLLGISS